ncbi:MAG TPA: ZIP family metal transporter [Nitrososphaera sp.]|nr:ZIP family metal transporter [Nitrososphaera sp.]
MEKDEIHRRSSSSSSSSSLQPRWFASAKMVAIALVPLAVLAAMIAFIFGPGQQFLGVGTPLPEISIERIEFQEGGRIIAYIRNTGPIDVTVAQADVNDRILPAAIEPSKELPRLVEAKVIIPFPWNEGEPYDIGVTSSDGTRFSKGVNAAAPAPTPDIEQAAFFGLIGTYVGIIPVLAGLLWLPFIKRLSLQKYRFFLSLTAGLLVFLGIDALVEGSEIAAESVAGVFNGQILIVLVAILSFLVLMYASKKLGERSKDRITTTTAEEEVDKLSAYDDSIHASQAKKTMDQQQQQQQHHLVVVKPVAMALMISIGIGLHNFGEGLAIGASVVLGEIALSTFLIVGFMIHNTTEGLAIVSPLAKTKVRRMIGKIIIMGLIAGVPTIIGTWIGGFIYSPVAAIIFLSIGAGAIFQVVFLIYQGMAKEETERGGKIMSDASIIAGFAAGMLIMYVTGLMI